MTVLGYVGNMPELMAASDVVVTNGAGNTVLEAFQTGRPVIAFSPLAGHGVASAVQMARMGLALEAKDGAALVEQVRRLREEQGLMERMRASVGHWAKTRSMADSLAAIESLYQERSPAASGRSGQGGGSGHEEGQDGSLARAAG